MAKIGGIGAICNRMCFTSWNFQSDLMVPNGDQYVYLEHKLR